MNLSACFATAAAIKEAPSGAARAEFDADPVSSSARPDNDDIEPNRNKRLELLADFKKVFGGFALPRFLGSRGLHS
jgi:hypothetical protein